MSEPKARIDRFVGDFAFLSNFYPSPIIVNGKAYKTIEAAYQAAKTLDPVSQEMIRNAKTPAIAKKLGQAVVLRQDWDKIKFNIMRDLIKKKFENAFLRPMLLATEDAELVENNHWNDVCWGVCRGVGENWLGRMLMEERDSIKKELQ